MTRTQHRQFNTLGFTLLELMVTVTIIAVVAVVVVPQLRNNDRLRVMAAAQIITSDIEAAQVLTISYPDDPIVVRFDTANDQYWLADSDTPNTPIAHQPSGADYLVEMGFGRAVSAQGVTMTITNAANDTIEFESSGGLADFTTAPVIRLQLGDAVLELIISPTTGTVIQQEPAEEEEEEGGGLGGLEL